MILGVDEIEKRVKDSYELPNQLLEVILKPVVTVLTITYQHAPYIKDCMEGVLSQKTTFPVEYIIGEDFSTDGTREIVFEYAQKYPEKIRVITADYNVGAKANGTRCRRASRGKYIALCEGDDYWIDPLKLQKQVDFLEVNPEYSFCFHGAKIISVGDVKRTNVLKEVETREYTGEEILKEWTIPTASVVYRDSAFTPIYNPNFLFGDIITFLSLSEDGKIWCMKEEMSVYRRHPGGITSSYKSIKNRIKHQKKFIKHYQAIRESFGGKYRNTTDILIAKVYIGLSKTQIKDLDIRFIVSLYKAYKQSPSVFIQLFIRSYFGFMVVLKNKRN